MSLCLPRMQLLEATVRAQVSSHIKAEFSISSQFPQSSAGSGVVTPLAEVAALLDKVLHLLQLDWCGQRQSTHRYENSGLSQMWKQARVERMTEKSVWLQELCLSGGNLDISYICQQ